MSEDCVFCKIIKGTIPCAKIYEDDKIIAFLDIAPVNKGHTLVVPKKHSENMLKDNDSDLERCIKVAKFLGEAIIKATKADGLNFSTNINRAAGQAVMHTHFHLIPRFNNDGFKHWPQGRYNDKEMEIFKNKIINSLIIKSEE